MSPRLPADYGDKLRAKLAECTPAARRALFRDMGEYQCERLLHSWPFWAREDQRWDPDGKEETTAWVTGRGYGKNRCCAETCNEVSEHYSEMIGGEMVLIGQTATDMRAIMIEGRSGVVTVANPWFVPHYEPSKMLVTWPNGVVAHLRSSEKPGRIRGLSVGFAWGDEIAHWFNPEECWDNLDFALREGRPSKRIVSTTPLPTKFIRRLIADPTVKVIRGTTHDNAANLDPGFIARLEAKYGLSKKGRQELYGEVVEDNANACFESDHIRRMPFADARKIMVHVAVGIDPSGGEASAKADETGIVAMGIDEVGNLYVLHDWSGDMSSAKWGAKAIGLAVSTRVEYGVSTPVYLVGENNFGGDMVESVCKLQPNWRAAGLRFEMVRAVGSKSTRADPISERAELGRYFHVGAGTEYRDLENQMTQWDATLPRRVQDSPDRMDAMVHVATFLLAKWDANAAQMAKLTAAQMARIKAKLAGA